MTMSLQHQSQFINQLETRKIHHKDSSVTTNTLEDEYDDTINLQLKLPTKYSDYEFKKNYFVPPSKEILGMDENAFISNIGLPYRKEKNIQLFHFKKESNELSTNPLPEFKYFMNMLPQIIYERLISKFSKPTPVQAQSWPLLLQGNDLIGLAETGSGKTLAFLIPLIVHVLDQMKSIKKIKERKHPLKSKGPMAIILAPTRELALQIESEIDWLKNLEDIDIDKFEEEESEWITELNSIRIVCAVGGETRRKQIKSALKGSEIIVGTPGRVLDFLVEGVFDLTRTTYVVMDEADRMLEMGFQAQIRKVLSQIRPDRQTAMFSATWDRGVQDLSGAFLSNPYTLSIGNATNAANTHVKQEFKFMRETDKNNVLLQVLEEIVTSPASRVLIFCNSKRSADEVVALLRTEGWPSLSIHGDRSQKERQWVISEFKSGGTPILCATDVAGRGIDIENIQCVINYDMPPDVSVYVHRIGRTGRAGKDGLSITFFTPDDCFITEDLIDLLTKSKQKIPEQLHELQKMVQEETDKKKEIIHEEKEERKEKKRKRESSPDIERKNKKRRHDYNPSSSDKKKKSIHKKSQ